MVASVASLEALGARSTPNSTQPGCVKTAPLRSGRSQMSPRWGTPHVPLLPAPNRRPGHTARQTWGARRTPAGALPQPTLPAPQLPPLLTRPAALRSGTHQLSSFLQLQGWGGKSPSHPEVPQSSPSGSWPFSRRACGSARCPGTADWPSARSPTGGEPGCCRFHGPGPPLATGSRRPRSLTSLGLFPHLERGNCHLEDWMSLC